MVPVDLASQLAQLHAESMAMRHLMTHLIQAFEAAAPEQAKPKPGAKPSKSQGIDGDKLNAAFLATWRRLVEVTTPAGVDAVVVLDKLHREAFPRRQPLSLQAEAR